MDFRPTDAQAVLRRTVREFAEHDIAPHVMRMVIARQLLSPKTEPLGKER